MLTIEQFNIIKEEARRNGIPIGLERLILREYLQCEFLTILYSLAGSELLALIGGTGLRLLYNLDRFSEDLDFDNCGLPTKKVIILFNQMVQEIKRRSYEVVFKAKQTGPERGGKLTIKNLLFPLKISPHLSENLMIKFEYTTPRTPPQTTTTLLNRFGFVSQIVTEPLEVLCARKAIALIGRLRVQPRDLYDLTWFFSHRIAPHQSTLKNFGIKSIKELASLLSRRVQTIFPRLKEYERDLAPLLLQPEKAKQIRLFKELLAKVLREWN